eukprot:4259327-Prorocentrum_lima.AAC.1
MAAAHVLGLQRATPAPQRLGRHSPTTAASRPGPPCVPLHMPEHPHTRTSGHAVSGTPWGCGDTVPRWHSQWLACTEIPSARWGR